MRATRLGCAMVTLLFMMPAAAHAQTRLVLTMPGEGGRAAAPVEIPVSSFTHTIGSGRDQPSTNREAGSGLATGRRQHHPVTFSTPFGTSTVQLQQFLARGVIIPTAELRIAARAGAPAGTVTLTNARVSGVTIEMLPGGEVVQRVELVYERYRVTAGTASHEEAWSAGR